MIRKINRCKVLNTIRLGGMISRADIAKANGLSQAAVTGITNELIKEKLIFEKQVGESHASGRKPILLALNPEAPPVLGVKLAKSGITVALTNIKTEIIQVIDAPVTEQHNSVESVIALITDTVKKCLDLASMPLNHVGGVGIGLAGLIDAQNGVCLFTQFFGWKNVPVKKLVEKELQLPVYIENNVKTLTMAEKWFGFGKGIDNFLLITIGRGVGLSMVLNGEIFRGSRGYGGEFGHITIDPSGKQCYCGKRGCLETFVADSFLLQRGKETLGKTGEWSREAMDELDIEIVTQMAIDGHKGLIQDFSDAGGKLGCGIATLINLLEPERIIITGEGVRAKALLMDHIQKGIAEHTLDTMDHDIEVLMEPCSDADWARGAASLALQEIFSMPR